EIRERTGDDRTPEQVAEGYLQIAVANIAAAVKRISVQKGHDVTRYALTTFGGAGGQHACMVADSLGIRTVLVPPMAGVLSALGIGLADTTAMREQSVEVPLEPASMPGVEKTADDLETAARAELRAEDVPDERIEVTRRAQLRYDGTDTTLTLEPGQPEPLRQPSEARHRATYPFPPDRPAAVEATSVHATPPTRPPPPRPPRRSRRRPAHRPPPHRRRLARRAPAPPAGTPSRPDRHRTRDHHRGRFHHRRRRRLARRRDRRRAPGHGTGDG